MRDRLIGLATSAVLATLAPPANAEPASAGLDMTLSGPQLGYDFSGLVPADVMILHKEVEPVLRLDPHWISPSTPAVLRLTRARCQRCKPRYR